MKSYIGIVWDNPLNKDEFLNSYFLHFCNSNESLRIYLKVDPKFIYLKKDSEIHKLLKKYSFKAFFVLVEAKQKDVNRVDLKGMKTLRDLRKCQVSVPIFLFSFLKKEIISSKYQYEIDEKYLNFYVRIPEFKSVISYNFELSELSEAEMHNFINSVIEPKGKAELMINELFSNVHHLVNVTNSYKEIIHLFKNTLIQISNLLPEIKKSHIKDVIFHEIKNDIERGILPELVIETYKGSILHKVERYADKN